VESANRCGLVFSGICDNPRPQLTPDGLGSSTGNPPARVQLPHPTTIMRERPDGPVTPESFFPVRLLHV